jgi:hypothetical protein
VVGCRAKEEVTTFFFFFFLPPNGDQPMAEDECFEFDHPPDNNDPIAELRIAIAWPRKQLRHMGLRERSDDAAFKPICPTLNPRLWNYCALYVVAQTLIDYGYLDARSLSGRDGEPMSRRPIGSTTGGVYP